MTKEKTGKAVRSMKSSELGGATDKGPVQTQVHAGNIGPLTVQLLHDINIKLGKLLEVANG